MSAPEPVEFTASLPPILSAIRMGQDSWRVQLDIPRSDIGNAAGLLAYFGQTFRVRVTPDTETTAPYGESPEPTENARPLKRHALKRRV